MRRATFAFVAVALVLGAAAPALACSCARNPTAAGILSSAAAVFTATVIDTKPIGDNASVTTFRITETFKGPGVGSSVEVRHRSGSSASCGVQFTPGRSYTLAVHHGGEDAATLTTSLCSTWMFLPQVRLSQGLIDAMRALRGRGLNAPRPR